MSDRGVFNARRWFVTIFADPLDAVRRYWPGRGKALSGAEGVEGSGAGSFSPGAGTQHLSEIWGPLIARGKLCNHTAVSRKRRDL